MDFDKAPQTALKINRAMADELTAAYRGERLSQAKLAEMSGMTLTTLQRILSGKRDINVTQIAALAEAVKVSPEDLMRRAIERAERMPN